MSEARCGDVAEGEVLVLSICMCAGPSFFTHCIVHLLLSGSVYFGKRELPLLSAVPLYNGHKLMCGVLDGCGVELHPPTTMVFVWGPLGRILLFGPLMSSFPAGSFVLPWLGNWHQHFDAA